MTEQNIKLIISILESMENRIDELYDNIEIGGDDYSDLKDWLKIIKNKIN